MPLSLNQVSFRESLTNLIIKASIEYISFKKRTKFTILSLIDTGCVLVPVGTGCVLVPVGSCSLIKTQVS